MNLIFTWMKVQKSKYIEWKTPPHSSVRSIERIFIINFCMYGHLQTAWFTLHKWRNEIVRQTSKSIDFLKRSAKVRCFVSDTCSRLAKWLGTYTTIQAFSSHTISEKKLSENHLIVSDDSILILSVWCTSCIALRAI